MNYQSFYLIICLHSLQLLVSGGVDSTVCAALLRVALQPSQVMAVHIDNGEMTSDKTFSSLMI